ncbi:hypothetical protein NEHOM01_0581 [Nematocida homosporus]|uniref:uncharacterized protein n=1 Tax=Nematocida homosporus TaxID=1912981 RepID=UPI00221F9D89|nr:uncharacterized protein NEHOM01_0581 [Nematocida homosporus]KAI5185076.1 hypothetical protein NEHOM01_0581 [Nematocida homosporus]
MLASYKNELARKTPWPCIGSDSLGVSSFTILFEVLKLLVNRTAIGYTLLYLLDKHAYPVIGFYVVSLYLWSIFVISFLGNTNLKWTEATIFLLFISLVTIFHGRYRQKDFSIWRTTRDLLLIGGLASLVFGFLWRYALDSSSLFLAESAILACIALRWHNFSNWRAIWTVFTTTLLAYPSYLLLQAILIRCC